MKAVLLKNVKKGEFFTLTDKVKCNEFGEVLSRYVYVREDYCRECKKYEVTKYEDFCNYRFLKGDRIVYVGCEIF